jgi:hypothetical protein
LDDEVEIAPGKLVVDELKQILNGGRDRDEEELQARRAVHQLAIPVTFIEEAPEPYSSGQNAVADDSRYDDQETGGRVSS